MADVKIIFAVLAIIVSITGYYPYFRDLFRSRTQPHMYTWLIWMSTQSIAVAGIWRGGGGWGAIYLIVSLACVVSVFLLSFRYGSRNITTFDTVALVAAFAALGVWWRLNDPVLAVVVATMIDLIGYVPTYRKSFEEPWSETAGTWLVFVAANILSIFALGAYNVLTLTYIAATTFANLAVAMLCVARRRYVPRP
jgi:hypothetical protein